MAEVIIYSTPICPYCARAKALLERKGVSYTDIDVYGDRSLRAEMTEKAGGRTSVPQIFIDNDHIGGCRELYALENAGHLDKLLAA